MRFSLSKSVWTVSAGAVAIVVAGIVTAATGASGATPATTPAKVPVLSHQLCYTAVAKGFKIPKQGTVRLINQLSPNGFLPKIGPAVLNCNPAEKILPSGKVFPITYPAGHLACYRIGGFAKQPTPDVAVANQFGKAVLGLKQPTLLCLPTWKSLTGPPKPGVVQPPGLDHFTCYPIARTNGKFVPPAVQLKDEFTKKPVRPDIRAVPTLFCIPTEKLRSVGGTVSKSPIVHPKGSLVCFLVGPTPIKPQVFDLNQFGRAVVKIHKTALLCLPSAKAVKKS
jgi:hypothetical protein